MNHKGFLLVQVKELGKTYFVHHYNLSKLISSNCMVFFC